jgi:hypothetical protein
MNLTHSGRLMFVGLITQADDEGRGLADERRLKAAVFPGDDCKLADVEGWLADVEKQSLCLIYDGPHGRLYQLTGWHHQKVPKAQPSNYPPPTGFIPKHSSNGIGTVSNHSSGIGRIGEEGRGEEGRKGETRARVTPSVDGLDLSAWDVWTAYRIEIRRPLKQASIPAAQRKLAAYGAEQSAVVEQSIANGWQGLFPLKLNGTHPTAEPRKTRYEQLAHRGS